MNNTKNRATPITDKLMALSIASKYPDINEMEWMFIGNMISTVFNVHENDIENAHIREFFTIMLGDVNEYFNDLLYENA